MVELCGWVQALVNFPTRAMSKVDLLLAGYADSSFALHRQGRDANLEADSRAWVCLKMP